MLKGDVLWKPVVHVVQIKQHIKDNYMYTFALGHLGFFGSPLSLVFLLRFMQFSLTSLTMTQRTTCGRWIEGTVIEIQGELAMATYSAEWQIL